MTFFKLQYRNFLLTAAAVSAAVFLCVGAAAVN